MIYRALILIVFAVFFGCERRPTLRVIASCNQADVQNAINAANDGDTITIPAGTCSWATGITISKAITLQGAGIGATIIRDGASPATLMVWNLVANKASQMTGIEFQDAGRSGSPYIITLNGGVSNVDNRTMRVDHCKFDHLNGFPLSPSDIIGVIDHNTFLFSPGQIPLYIYHGNWNNQGPYAGGSWSDSSGFGTAKFLFIEDNTFTNDGAPYAAIDACKGARVVFRYNTVSACYLSIHGTDSCGLYRGGRAYEIYNNTFTNSTSILADARSAVLVVHHNTGMDGGRINLLVDRAFFPFGQWGTADGTNGWDINDKTDYSGNGIGGGVNGKKASGTAASGGTDPGYYNWPTVTVAGTPWTPNAFAGFSIKKTEANSADQKASYIHANTNNTITYSPPQGFGTTMTFSSGNTFEIHRVLTALDQPGRARGSLIAQTDPSSPPSGWNDQVTDPCYEWNNGTCHFLSNVPEIVRINEHFFNSTVKPGYTPYTYPHPLVSSAPVSTPTATPAPSTPTAAPTPTPVPTATISPTAPPVPPQPAAPSELRAQIVKGKDIELSWVDNANDEIGFELQRTDQIDGQCVPYPISTMLPKNTRNWVDTSTVKKKTYCFHIRAQGENGTNSAWSAEVIITP
jgi:hypothetical protein